MGFLSHSDDDSPLTQVSSKDGPIFQAPGERPTAAERQWGQWRNVLVAATGSACRTARPRATCANIRKQLSLVPGADKLDVSRILGPDRADAGRRHAKAGK